MRTSVFAFEVSRLHIRIVGHVPSSDRIGVVSRHISFSAVVLGRLDAIGSGGSAHTFSLLQND